jgi:hypothetical protein
MTANKDLRIFNQNAISLMPIYVSIKATSNLISKAASFQKHLEGNVEIT